MEVNAPSARFLIIHACLLFLFTFSVGLFTLCAAQTTQTRRTENFCQGWRFHLGDVPDGQTPGLDDAQWRALDLPHDWSIEGEFSKENPATPGGGALPGGIGWYRKSFATSPSDKENLTFIEFDGVYRNSEVWINGHSLGKRPYGYSSFRYELTPFLTYDGEKNVLAVRVDNSQQPNSRWYSGSGIYRNVWLVTCGVIHVDHWGTFVTTPEVTSTLATVSVRIRVRNASNKDQAVVLRTSILDGGGKSVASTLSDGVVPRDSLREFTPTLKVGNPALWSMEDPRLYKAVTRVEAGGRAYDTYETTFGIRTFTFDSARGFFLNGEQMKITGVCEHHDLGCLGAAVNTRAIERQLELLKGMGVNGIRTSHNPPAPELLDLCDRMGFIVMDEAYDMWKKKKTEYDYALWWDAWHRRDIEDMVLRDRNHPSVFIWSIGNEVVEQWDKNDSSGVLIARELAGIVKEFDTTRPITANCNDPDPMNPVIRSGALDLIGYSYHHDQFAQFPQIYPGKKFIGSETTSALETRGSYDMPSDSIRRWPVRWDIPLRDGNADHSCSSYDNCSTPWGSTHEETWKVVKKYPFLSGMYVWTGFDYLGEPTPYDWPSRSSYFGILDLAGFPKDPYYMYQSEWTKKPVLHLFPHWNWNKGDVIDVWAYSNCDNVELFLNGQSLGTRRKAADDLHFSWRVPFAPGVLKAVGRTGGNTVLEQEIKTAGPAARIILTADRSMIAADGKDLSFVTVAVVDAHGNLVPYADNGVHFSVAGQGRLAAVDNGLQTSLESFRADARKAFHGLCLAVIRSTNTHGRIILNATSEGLKGATIEIESQ